MMTTTDQFLVALQAFQEIQAELRQQDGSIPDTASSQPVVQDDKLPGGSLLLGLAEDGLPLLLDLYDPLPGPILVAGDGGCGKTAYLQSLARATDIHDPGDIQFGVLTPFPEEWTGYETLPGCLGVWPAYHPSGHDFLAQLVSWSETLPSTRQVVLLFVDGLDLLVASDYQARHDLRWLLTNGPARHVWPVVTVNPGRLDRMQTWLDYFGTRILGQVKETRNARQLVDNAAINLADLIPNKQFGLNQPGGLLKFWLTPIN
jgi:hypothetical protein